jgi:uncharacterized protein involved in exopolysaccharide biosynthesis
MAIILELFIAGALIYSLTRIALKVLDNRKELRQLREERVARLEAAKTAQDIVNELLLDKEMSGQVYEQLGQALQQDPNQDNDHQ